MTNDKRLEEIREFHDRQWKASQCGANMQEHARIACNDIAWLLDHIDALRTEAKAERGKALEDCEREIRSWAIVGKSADHYAKKISALMKEVK